MATMSFTEALRQVGSGADGARARVPEGWGQGRSIFGGLPAALVLRAMRRLAAGERRPRSLHVSFVAPVEAGEMDIEVRELRSGRSVTQLEARAVQQGSVRLAVLGGFGADRESSFTLASHPLPAAPAPESLTPLPVGVPGAPEFLRHFDLRWASGGPPYSGVREREMGGWIRFREETGPATEESILALVDAWPSPVLSMLETRAPASSLAWTVELMHMDPAARLDDWWFFRAAADSAEAGYAHGHAALWDAAGNLAALSRQTVAVFA